MADGVNDDSNLIGVVCYRDKLAIKTSRCQLVKGTHTRVLTVELVDIDIDIDIAI